MDKMGNPPQLNVNTLLKKDLPYKSHEFSKNFVLDFLLLTTVDCEFTSCIRYLQEPLKYYDLNTGVVFVGKLEDESEQEKLTIGLMKCGMGSGVGGSAVTVQNAVTTLNPKGVFCVGFCGGMNANKAKLGDVVVSAKLISYAPCKVIADDMQQRGTNVPLGKKLYDIMQYADHGWNPPLKNTEETGPKVVLGTMLSGPVLVNSKTERDRLLNSYPNAIGIEMEGEGKISFT